MTMHNAPSDRDYQEHLNPFYAEAVPCESCGEPTNQQRVWNVEHELWVAVDCSCNTPDEPLQPCLIAVLEAATTVNELREGVRGHLKTCSTCNPKLREFPKRDAGSEDEQEREAA